MTARGLGLSVDAVADHVRDWCQHHTQRRGEQGRRPNVAVGGLVP